MQAKAELDRLGLNYTAIELTGADADPDGAPLRAELAARVNRTSVPAIFIGGEFIGGCNDGPGLMTVVADGSLDTYLERCSPAVRKA